MGYISKDLNAFGQYTRTTDSTKRLLLEIDLGAAQLGPVDMMIVVSLSSSRLSLRLVDDFLCYAMDRRTVATATILSSEG